MVISSYSLSRKKVNDIDETAFCDGSEGFAVVSADKKQLTLRMVNYDGKVLHEVVRTKK